MWFLKLVGGLLVCGASAALGLYAASRGRFHIEELAEMKQALVTLASEIDYALCPLAEACGNVSRRARLTAGAFFGQMADRLSEGRTPAPTVWDAAASDIFPPSPLDAEDADNLRPIGRTLGGLDKALQLAGIRLAIQYIDGKSARLEAKSARDGRTYGSVGVISGLMAVILLF